MTALTAMLDEARPELAPDLPVPKALLLPHAGYIYSGSTAALGYAALERGRDTIRRVVLLGPTHRVWTDGVVLPGVDTLGTPLGEVRVARVGPELDGLPQVGVSPEAHAAEHSLEVHLPFLQMVLDDVEVVPLAVGRAEPGEVAEVLDALWGGAETAIVVSSDLSHYLSYDAAERVDEATVEQMLRLDLPLTHDQACGATPANGLLLAARRHGLVPRLLARCSSGDTAGDRRRVVGYAALAFLRPVTD
jgi:AmmeMemoRadiSam system protein B